jgi:hypothetical protein
MSDTRIALEMRIDQRSFDTAHSLTPTSPSFSVPRRRKQDYVILKKWGRIPLARFVRLEQLRRNVLRGSNKRLGRTLGWNIKIEGFSLRKA